MFFSNWNRPKMKRLTAWDVRDKMHKRIIRKMSRDWDKKKEMLKSNLQWQRKVLSKKMNEEVPRIDFLKLRSKTKRANYKMLNSFLKKRKKNWSKNKEKTISEIFKQGRLRLKTVRRSWRTMSMNCEGNRGCWRKSTNWYKQMHKN